MSTPLTETSTSPRWQAMIARRGAAPPEAPPPQVHAAPEPEDGPSIDAAAMICWADKARRAEVVTPHHMLEQPILAPRSSAERDEGVKLILTAIERAP
jgi:hypothetical protein